MTEAKRTQHQEGLRRFRSYEDRKQSGLEGLGTMPAHWYVLRAKALEGNAGYLAQTGPFGAQLHASDYLEYGADGVSLILIKHVNNLSISHEGLPRISQETAIRLAEYRVETRDIVFSRVGSVGRIGLVTDDESGWLISGQMLRLRFRNPCLHGRYVLYAISSDAVLAYFDLMSVGTTRDSINTTILRDMPLPIPPIAEQRGIATFLDRETSRIDALVAKKERLKELLQEERTALITRAVTRGLDPNVPTKDSGVEGLDEYPTHWTGLPLKRWVAVKITDGPHETPELVTNGVDFISAEAVSNGRIDFAKRRGFISPDLHAYYCRKCRPVRDDILLCKSGATTGKLARVDVDFEFSVWSPLALVRANRSRIFPAFLELALGSEYVQKQIKRTWSAGTQPNISMGDLEQLFVVAPSIEEQAKILEQVNQMVGGFDGLSSRVGHAIERLKELRTALISATVTGKIDVREEVA